MCANCVTRLDAAAFQVGGVVAAGASGWRWLAGNRGLRRARAYEDNARFLRSLDLDPEVVLGPPPSVPVAP